MPNASKLFEHSLYGQLASFFDNVLSIYCFFRKGFSAQQCFMALVNFRKMIEDKKEAFEAFFTDSSIASDCINHELLIT